MKLQHWLAGLSLFCLTQVSSAQNIFTEVSTQVGINAIGANIGVAFGDYNNDGLEDLYIATREGDNKLYKNIDGTRFEEVGRRSGVGYKGSSRVCVWLDINNDGFLDLYVGNFGEKDILYFNNGDGTFRNISDFAGIFGAERVFSVSAVDINQDSWVDIYVANFKEENKFYINNGNNTFSEEAEKRGAISKLNAMGTLFFDFDNDNDNDLYLVHDGQPNILYENIGGGNFKDVSSSSKTNDDGFGMGVDVADVNRDGLLDLYVTNLFENVLYINQGDGIFKDVSTESAVDDYGMGWGTTFLDYDNDGWVDIYVANDSYFSDFPNILYKNRGGLNFEPVAFTEKVSSMKAGYGSASADFNNDGQIDLALANAGKQDRFELFQNNGYNNNWVKFQLQGVESNKFAIGARIELIDENDVLHTDEINIGSGYASQNSYRLLFGLGQASLIKSLKIRWPSGKRQSFENIDINQFYKIVEGQAPQAVNLTTSNNDILVKRFQLNLFPNPASKELNLTFEVEKKIAVAVNVMDQNGKILHQMAPHNAAVGTNQITINGLSSWPNGMYTIKLITDQGVVSKVFIKNK
ncbi:MAG: FG-GAP-like repeat-containing protein [Bacteroidota bacterium]